VSEPRTNTSFPAVGGTGVGVIVGTAVGTAVGSRVGTTVGDAGGASVAIGVLVGGAFVGNSVGLCCGLFAGCVAALLGSGAAAHELNKHTNSQKARAHVLTKSLPHSGCKPGSLERGVFYHTSDKLLTKLYYRGEWETKEARRRPGLRRASFVVHRAF
jgi:hypothetical protein